MKFIFTVFILLHFALVSADALLAEGSKIEANHGEDVTLFFQMDKAEEAGRLRIIFTPESKKKSLIARRCAGSEECDPLETPGVKLRVEHGLVNVFIQKVNRSRSGLYEARAYYGKEVCEVYVTLVVKEASSSSTSAPSHSSIPNPADSSLLLWMCALVPLIIIITIIFIISGVVCFRKRRKIQCFQRKDPESIIISGSVSMNGVRDKAEVLLTDT